MRARISSPGRTLVAALALSMTCAGMLHSAPAGRTLALTFDDLPYVNLSDGRERPQAERVTATLLRVLKAHHAPAIGFVNESKLAAQGGSAILQRWMDAGMTLGNHTWSHPDFNERTVEQFEDEIVSGDVVTRRLMASTPSAQLYFRHPMTHTGDTRAKKEAIEGFLAARGYIVAPHTIENSDYIYNVGYVRATEKKDAALAARLRDNYLDFTFAATAFAEEVSPRIFGREVAQTLLIHANDLNAACLDEILARYEARGYRFVTLDEAMRDPAYRTKDTYVGTFGPTWLFRWMKSLNLNVSFSGDPDPPKWVMDLYHQR